MVLRICGTKSDRGHPVLWFWGEDGDQGRICIRVPNELQIQKDQLEMGSVCRPLHSTSEAAKGGDQVEAKVSCSTDLGQCWQTPGDAKEQLWPQTCPGLGGG